MSREREREISNTVGQFSTHNLALDLKEVTVEYIAIDLASKSASVM